MKAQGFFTEKKEKLALKGSKAVPLFSEVSIFY